MKFCTGITRASLDDDAQAGFLYIAMEANSAMDDSAAHPERAPDIVRAARSQGFYVQGYLSGLPDEDPALLLSYGDGQYVLWATTCLRMASRGYGSDRHDSCCAQC